MELNDALDQIAQIRSQMARTAVFRGYRSLTVGFSSLLAILAAVAQSIWIPHPAERLDAYLALWITTAALSAAVIVTEILVRALTSPSALAREKTLLALEHFAPSMAAGALLTLAIAQAAVDACWMLPGLWGMVFGLGVFASSRQLPRAVVLVGTYYLAGGAAALIHGAQNPLAPWWMGLLFGGGQCLTAAILYFTLERTDVRAGQK